VYCLLENQRGHVFLLLSFPNDRIGNPVLEKDHRNTISPINTLGDDGQRMMAAAEGCIMNNTLRRTLSTECFHREDSFN
jgi:hypothetical protein